MKVSRFGDRHKAALEAMMEETGIQLDEVKLEDFPNAHHRDNDLRDSGGLGLVLRFADAWAMHRRAA